MKYHTLGRTGLLVSEVCLGTMTFAAGEGMWKSILGVEQDLADKILKRSFEAGVNFVDTADVYTDGESEKTLAKAISNVGIARKDIVIATKVFGRTGPGRNDVGASRSHIMDGVEQSLKRLQTDYIDLYQIHAADSVTPVEETLRALNALVEHGKVRYIGCSNWYAWQLMKALGVSEAENLVKMDSLQAYYSIAGRDLEREIVPLLKDQGTGLLVWSPLAGAFSRASIPARTRSRRTHAALSLTSQSWIRSAPGASWMFFGRSPRRTTRAWPRSHWLGCWQSHSLRRLSLARSGSNSWSRTWLRPICGSGKRR